MKIVIETGTSEYGYMVVTDEAGNRLGVVDAYEIEESLNNACIEVV